MGAVPAAVGIFQAHRWDTTSLLSRVEPLLLKGRSSAQSSSGGGSHQKAACLFTCPPQLVTLLESKIPPVSEVTITQVTSK